MPGSRIDSGAATDPPTGQGARRPTARGGFLPEPWLRRMFETVAPRYDLQNYLLSLGRDASWRRTFVERLRLEAGCAVGDLAVGTGEIAIAVCLRYPGVRVVGVDISRGMMRVAGRKIRSQGLESRISLLQGDLRDLPIPDASLDALTMSFGIRNIPERLRVLRECRRVLRPGGKLSVMEMVIPASVPVRAVYGLYLDGFMPVAGNLMSGTDYAYSYLRRSIRSFPQDDEFVAELGRAGFERARASRISWGMAAIYAARRPLAEDAP